MGFLPQKHNAAPWRSPFYELEKLHREMNHFFDLSLPGDKEGDPLRLTGFWSPAIDVIDKKDSIMVKADLPGLTRDDIDITIEANLLTIRGEKKVENEIKEGDLVRSERYYGTFHRAFTLPSIVDAEKVKAKFDNGVLELVIAKKEEAKPRQIRVDVK